MIEARDLSFVVDGRALLAPLDLSLPAGEMLVVVGPNGAGKSTLLKLLTGELAPSSGQVTIDDAPLRAIPPWRLACRRAVMAQAARLSFPFLVHEVVGIGTDCVGRARSDAARDGLVAEALAAADIGHLAGRPYQTLSGGEQQRVQFARVLAQLAAGRGVEQRQALFLDEPVSSLDLCHQLALLDEARRLADAGLAVLAILHDLNLAAAYADRILVLDGGRAVACGAPRAVLDEALLAGSFGVSLALNRVPEAGAPFVLPHGHRDRAKLSAPARPVGS